MSNARSPVHDSHATTDVFILVEVPCAKCGDGVGCEVPQGSPKELLAFCEGCRDELLAAPTLPAGYELVRELGRGGMGAVYLAQHRVLGLLRAVKVILPHGALSEAARAQFLNEARIHAGLSHPRIVQVHDLSEVRPAVFAIVMEYVDGPNAGQLLSRRAPDGLEPAEAVGIACQALEGLAYVHARGILHCDVKDANLLVALQAGGEATPAVKLSDFGLARTFAVSGASSRCRTDVTSGTIAYMSPEQALCEPLSPESDVYSLGATLYRLLTGRTPHEFPEGRAPLDVARYDPVVPALSRRPDLPLPLAAAVDRSLARERSDRFASAEEMRQALIAVS